MIQQDLFPDDRYHANWHWLAPDFDDVAIQREIEAAIAAGRVKLPARNYPMPRPYQGATSEQRAYGEAISRLSRIMGSIPSYSQCSVCSTSMPLRRA